MGPPTFIITDKAEEKNYGQMCGILFGKSSSEKNKGDKKNSRLWNPN